jgi:8-amino-7-oxononanoate synthase
VAAAAALGVPFVDASLNDYLGLAGLSVSRETSVQRWPGGGRSDLSAPDGAGASRLIHGTRAAHLALEDALADWVGFPAALLFSSGYAANVGLLQAIGAPGSLIVSDALNHASIVDGCRLSRARVAVTPHLDLEAVGTALASSTESPKWVVVESCFSMDGDEADLAGLRSLCDSHGAGLVVDEAHALGVFGPAGAGRCAECGVRPDALVGTLGKAVGVQGAFVAGSSELRALLWNRARSFVFSTAPSPALCAATLFHVQRAREADAARARLTQLTSLFRAALRASGARVPERGSGPIVPVLVGTNERALALAQRLRATGILAQAIRYPTVPEGSARVRLIVSAAWPEGAVERVAEQVSLGLRELP